MGSFIQDYIISHYSGVSTIFIFLEFIAAITGTIYVILARKESVWCYPYGILGTSVYIYLSYISSTYGYMIIQTYYFIMGVYGWYLWVKKPNLEDNLKVTTMKYKDYLRGVLLFALSFVFVILFINYFKDSDDDISYLEIFATSLSFCAMWLIVRKKIENWLIWIFSNFMFIILFSSKGMLVTTLLHFIYFSLSFSGYFKWKKILNK